MLIHPHLLGQELAVRLGAEQQEQAARAQSLAAATLFVTLVRGGPARGGLLAILSRAVRLLVLNGLIVVLCAALLNDKYLFYVSWADLSAGPSSATTVTRGGQPQIVKPLKPILRYASETKTLPPLPNPGSREQSYVVTGADSKVSGQILVQLPAGYDPNSTRTYPVIEALHGWPVGPRAVAVELDLHGAFQRLIDARKVADPIIVMPQINTPLTLDTECVDPPAGTGPKSLTWIGRDVPQWAADHFRVAHGRQSWLVLGASYGGWCAANVGMHYPEIFGGAVSFMGYFAPEFAPTYDPYVTDPLGERTYDLAHLADTAPPPIALWLMASREDLGAYRALVKLLKVAHPPTSVTAHILATGGHRIQTIPPTLPAMASWLTATLPGFVAHA